MIRAAIFDLDGTLADTAADLVAAANAVAAEEGWPALDPVGDRTTAGRGSRALLRLAMARAGCDDADRVERLVPRFLELYEDRIDAESRLFPGALACLDALQADGWRLGLCTNKPEGLARLLLDRLGIAARFAAILGADTLPVRKPDPLHLIETVRRAGGVITQAVLIGDTDTDRRTASAAGTPCILTRFGYATVPPETLAPEALIDDLSEVPAVAAALLANRAPAAAHTGS